MSVIVAEALQRWGMEGAESEFVAGRENQVHRITGPEGNYALRIHRPGLRSDPELVSELGWLEEMDRAGLSVPRPKPSASGALLETIGGNKVDMAGWLPGQPLGRSREKLELTDSPRIFQELGSAIARLHDACDALDPPEGFVRAAWDADGLLGEDPLWGRFWESPMLDGATRELLEAFRGAAAHELGQLEGSLDYGLIHADLARENVLIDGDRIRLIDFDDGGFGFRLFDIATVVIKNRGEQNQAQLRESLLEGYRTIRSLDAAHLDLFIALRAASYVGWIAPRIAEEGAKARSARFIAEARELCSFHLGIAQPA